MTLGVVIQSRWLSSRYHFFYYITPIFVFKRSHETSIKLLLYNDFQSRVWLPHKKGVWVWLWDKIEKVVVLFYYHMRLKGFNYFILTVVSWFYQDKINTIVHNHHYLSNRDDQVLERKKRKCSIIYNHHRVPKTLL